MSTSGNTGTLTNQSWDTGTKSENNLRGTGEARVTQPPTIIWFLTVIQKKCQKSRIARRLIFQRVYEALGLENAVDTPGGGFYVSAAPLSMQTFEYFESLGIELQGRSVFFVNGNYFKSQSSLMPLCTLLYTYTVLGVRSATTLR